jgi:D-alanyl-D-alanine carboxypeptidase-like protein
MAAGGAEKLKAEDAVLFKNVRCAMCGHRYILALVGIVSIAPCGAAGAAEERYGAAPQDMKEYLDRLVSAYPDTIKSYDDEFLTLRNGVKFRISDGRTDKNFDELLEKPDIDDMFYVRYPAGETPAQPPRNADPGRVRFEPLFVEMYGDCKRNEVARNLRAIEWLPRHGGGTVTVATANGVARALEGVSRELDGLPRDLVKYVMPTAGTYSCRKVAGSRARSMHAYGAAIDINTKYANYWRWGAGNAEKHRWRNHIPIEIVRIFEKYGFIWGGYWYHYDTMHFEYRPELLGR